MTRVDGPGGGGPAGDRSVARTLALHLSGFGALLYAAALAGPVALDAFRDPSGLRNAVALDVIERAVRRSAEGELALADTPALSELKASGPSFWFVVSDGLTLLEHNEGARPPLPIDIRLDGPILEADFEIGEGGPSRGGATASIRTVELAGRAGRVIVATTGGRPTLGRIGAFYLREEGVTILIVAAAFAILIAGAIALAVRQIARSIRQMVVAAAAIAPDDPRGTLGGTARVPAELRPLTQALDAALDRIAASMEQQRRFITNAAHELRTPLAILRLKVDEVSDPALRGRLVVDLHRLTALVAAMLDLARLRSPAADIPMQAIDLVELARAVVTDQAAAILDRGLQASFDAPDEPVLVSGNEAALRSAIANLVANAVAHAREATTLAVRVTPDRTVEVADDGPGIPPEHRREVLEPFVRLHSGAKGTGLGLAIVREIMAAHGGSLTVGETSGGGATLRLAFPSPESRQARGA